MKKLFCVFLVGLLLSFIYCGGLADSEETAHEVFNNLTIMNNQI